MLNIAQIVLPIRIYSSDFHFVSGPSAVYIVVMQDHLFLSRHSTGGHRSRCLLNSHFLVIFVQSSLVVFLVATLVLANHTPAQVLLSFILVFDLEGSLDISTRALEINLFELGLNAGSLHNHSSDFDEGVQMNLPQISEFIFNW